MKHWGPLITAAVVVLGLVGFMVVNSVGGLVVAKEQAQAGVGALPPTTTTAPPTTTTTSEEPEAPQFPGEVVYAGTADGSELAIAVAVKGDQAAAYLCDGERVEAWMRGTAVDGKVELKAADGSASVIAELSGDDLTGTAVANEQDFAFTITVAEKPAGLYRGEVGDATIGWIVLPDGSQVGIASSPDGAGPAPELDPEQGSVDVGGQQVDAAEVDGDTEF